jgi:ABC-type transport system involved in multi-copper enzyme maturation permease subunit
VTARLPAATRRIFDLALGEILWGRRAAFMALAAGAPVALALLLRLVLTSSVLRVNGARIDAEDIFATAISLLYLRFIVPALGVFYGTSLIADEVEEKTITYLFTRPIARSAVVLGKYLAYLLCACAFVLPSVGLVFIIMVPFEEMGPLVPVLLQHLAAMALGLASYGALFLWAGVGFKRPLVGSLIFVFGWEPVALVLPGYLRRLTIAYYLDAGAVGAAVLAGIALVALFFAMRTIERREYVLEQ